MIGIVTDDIPEAYINQHIALARPIKNINIKYLGIFLSAQNGGQNQFDKRKRGVTKSGLGLNNIRTLTIALPPLEEQNEIVSSVDSLSKTIGLIEQRYADAKIYVDKLQQTILAKAFKGELVKQDPNDEPAELLIERIKKEKIFELCKNKTEIYNKYYQKYLLYS